MDEKKTSKNHFYVKNNSHFMHQIGVYLRVLENILTCVLILK